MGNLTSALGKQFNAAEVEPSTDFSPIPAGVYDVEIESADVAETKSGNGMALKITYNVIGPSNAGRKIFDNINIRHTNPQAEQIGQKQLSSLCRAVGVMTPDDTDQFMGRRLRVRVKIRKQEGYDDRNEVTLHESMDGPAPAAAAAPAKPAAPKKPWERKAA